MAASKWPMAPTHSKSPAKDAAGKAVTVSTQFAGTVSGVSNVGRMVFNVGVLKVPLADVTGVRTPKPATDTPNDTNNTNNTNNTDNNSSDPDTTT